MEKKYVVRLSQDERDHLNEVVKKLNGSSQKVKRAQEYFLGTGKMDRWKVSSNLMNYANKTDEN